MDNVVADTRNTLAMFETRGLVWTDLLKLLGIWDNDMRRCWAARFDNYYANGAQGFISGVSRNPGYLGEEIGTRIYYRLLNMDDLCAWAREQMALDPTCNADALHEYDAHLEGLRIAYARHLLESV